MANQCQSPTFDIPLGIKELLHTNRVPTDVQRRDISDIIRVLLARKSDMELEKEQVRTVQTLHEVSDMISDPQATISPVKRMPDEILALIFEHCLPVRSFIHPSSFLGPTRVLALVQPALVCSSWRRIAHASPSLWCNVYLAIYGSAYIRANTLPRLLSWIRRSGSLPLSLTLQAFAPATARDFDDVFNTIALHAPRWKTMYICVYPLQHILRSLSCMFLKPFTGLFTLEISHFRCVGLPYDTAEPITLDFQKLPLRNLSLYLQGPSVKDLFVTCINMTRLFLDLEPPDGSASPLGKLLGILDRCVSLKERTLCLREDPELTPLPHVRFQHLQSLHIQIIYPSETSNRLDEFLDVTDFPSLSSLNITYHMPPEEPMTFPERLNPFLRRHTPSLRRFVFGTPSWEFNADDFLRILEGISSMTQLHVHFHRSQSIIPLVEALTPALHEGSLSCLLPHLEILTLRWNRLNTLSCIIEMVEMGLRMLYRCMGSRNSSALHSGQILDSGMRCCGGMMNMTFVIAWTNFEPVV